ncbi:hypothetical protein H1R17_04285 [Flavobacterium sp. xlx-214]|uniref:hypothetical protein n=1 Tax=unclassified Flavobacterium TaxID=196869 RepID=UPI0013D30141|nr:MULTISPECIES: hypothetical protein [unclassified Flavobacterium]MBA5792111.1 hypothetical protein [Flavobacterium sp. xlx-221]QMI84358.1 hypothetical protein H1R17_04285 [Flavobacterium sp. xlx-214]
MKKSEVPQDDSPLKNIKSNELVYALDDDGKFVSVQSTGWEAKSIVQYENLDVLDQRIQQALNDVKAGKVSPIVYFMELNRMDWQTLAAYMGKWTFLVKRHSKPSVFQSLSAKVLAKYAKTFGITVAELQNFKG